MSLTVVNPASLIPTVPKTITISAPIASVGNKFITPAAMASEALREFEEAFIAPACQKLADQIDAQVAEMIFKEYSDEQPK